MTQRFGGIFSNLSQREFVFLDRLFLEIPLTQYFYKETDLHNMSDLDIISILDDYIDTLSNLLQSRYRSSRDLGKWEYKGSPLTSPRSVEDPMHMEVIEGWRRAYPKVIALRAKLARKAGVS
jgi:hypothetical protein